jgi:hypothetical protein
MAGTVVVQELRWEVAAGHGNSSAASHIAINQEGTVLTEWPKLGEHVLAAGNHFIWVVGLSAPTTMFQKMKR